MHWEGKVRGLIIVGLLLLFAAALSGNPSDDVDYGYTPNPEGTARFLSELDQPFFSDAGSDAIQKAQGKDTFLYRAAYAAHQALHGEPWVVGRQGIGDCVSWGWAHGVWIAQCVDWEDGRLAQPPPFVATESIYGGSRVEARGKDGSGRSAVGGWSDGSYGGAAARWCRDWGVVYRELQPTGVDLSKYSSERAKQWGAYGNGGQGDGGKLDEVAKLHPVKHVALVKSFDEAAAAIESGYPVAVCSMAGFNSTRDSEGFCRRTQTWAHCMCFIAVRYDRPGLLCLNSWGPTYVSGPKWPSDMPDGSFWVDKSVVDSMLRGGDSFAIGGVDGLGWRDLHHGEWLDEARP